MKARFSMELQRKWLNSFYIQADIRRTHSSRNCVMDAERNKKKTKPPRKWLASSFLLNPSNLKEIEHWKVQNIRNLMKPTPLIFISRLTNKQNLLRLKLLTKDLRQAHVKISAICGTWKNQELTQKQKLIGFTYIAWYAFYTLCDIHILDTE